MLKTYGRKRSPSYSVSVPIPPSLAAEATPRRPSLIPPCHATLVGFRGLLLHQRHLRRQAGATTTNNKAKVDKVDANEELRHGIHNSGILEGRARTR